MKIVHLCLACFFPDHYAYQENLLPKYHKALGHDVEVIASTLSFDKNGKPCYLTKTGSYQNEYDIKVTRLPYRNPVRLWRVLRRYSGTCDALMRAGPDLLFIHGCQFLDADLVVRYIRSHPGIRVFVDNHADFSNSAGNWLSLHILHRLIWRHTARELLPYTEKFYGVLPARVDFLTEQYGLPPEKCELLVMGADDELVEEAFSSNARKRIRDEYHIKDDDFLVITGGKIDRWKTQTLRLMEAVREIESKRLRLIVFGSIAPELREEFDRLVDGVKVQYVGWVQASETYNYAAAADLAVFPGRHSVFWEQVAGQGIPLLVKDWPGTHHVDLGGNAIFLKESSTAEIRDVLQRLLDHPEELQHMKDVAAQEGMRVFSYRDIARRCIASVAVPDADGNS